MNSRMMIKDAAGGQFRFDFVTGRRYSVDSRIDWRWRDEGWPLLLSAVLCVVVLGWVAWRKLWLFWLDEAMLIVSIQHVRDFSGLFGPLPLYDQGGPIGLLAVSWGLAKAGLPLFTQKLLPLAAGFATVWAVAAAARRSGFGAVATGFAVFVLVGTTEFSSAFGDFKQYAFDMLAVSLLLLAAVSERRAAGVLLVLACAVGAVFSFVAPVLLVMLPFLYRRVGTPLLVLAGVLLAGFFLGSYLLYVADALRFQMGNYRDVYGEGFLSLSAESIRPAARLLMSHVPTISGRTPAFQILFVLVALLGTGVAVFRRERAGLMFVAVLAVMGGLSLLHLYPLLPGRYTDYLGCFTALMAGRAVAWAGGILRWPGVRLPPGIVQGARGLALVAPVVLVGFGLAVFVREGGWKSAIGQLPLSSLAAAERVRADAVVPVSLAQPQFDLVRERVRGPRVIEADTRSGTTVAEEEMLHDPDAAMERPGSWALLMKLEQVRFGWRKVGSGIDSSLYFGWLLGRIEDLHRVVLIAPTCLLPYGVDFGELTGRLAERGAVEELEGTPCYRTLLWTRHR